MIREMSGATYTDDEAPGAWPNGTRVIKTRIFDAVEANPVGTKGTVLGSIGIPAEVTALALNCEKFLYFVEWDTHPNLPVVVADSKLGLL